MSNGSRMPSMPGDDSSDLPEFLPAKQRKRVAVLTIIYNGQAFSPAEVYRRFDPEPDIELAHLPTLLEGLWAALAPVTNQGNRRVLARVSGAQRPFLAAWWEDRYQGVEVNPEDGLGLAIETLVLCNTCPVPEACALSRYCRVDQERAGAKAVDSPESTQQALSAQDAAGRPDTSLWHSLAAVDAQVKAEAQGQTWLNAPGAVERVLSKMQTLTWAACYACWHGQISRAEADYRQHVEVHWAKAILAGEHPSYAILPAWHRDQMPAYLRQVYYYQDQCVEWAHVPSLDKVVSGVLEACALAAGLQLQSIHPGAPFTYRLAEETEMAEDVLMHAAYFRGLVEDEGMDEK